MLSSALEYTATASLRPPPRILICSFTAMSLALGRRSGTLVNRNGLCRGFGVEQRENGVAHRIIVADVFHAVARHARHDHGDVVRPTALVGQRDQGGTRL